MRRWSSCNVSSFYVNPVRWALSVAYTEVVSREYKKYIHKVIRHFKDIHISNKMRCHILPINHNDGQNTHRLLPREREREPQSDAKMRGCCPNAIMQIILLWCARGRWLKTRTALWMYSCEARGHFASSTKKNATSRCSNAQRGPSRKTSGRCSAHHEVKRWTMQSISGKNKQTSNLIIK